MIKAKATIAQTQNKLPVIQQAMATLSRTDVLVGIPEGDTGAHPDITNAQLLYVLTHGVRSAAMREEMDDMMQRGPGDVPYSIDYNRFLTNLEGGMPYNAAYALYIHEHGSPLWRIPPRPVLEPALNNSKEVIAAQLKKTASVALAGADPAQELQKTGMLGQTIAREWFTNPLNRWPANAPSTIKAKGSDRPNIDTGNLRNAITYVVATKS